MCAKFIRDPERTREAILSAAERLIATKGFQAFSLDEVAQGAQISKGGVLHHFPNKVALLTGLMHQMLTEENRDIAAELEKDPVHPGAYTRAVVRTYLNYIDEACSRACSELCSEFRNVPALVALVDAHFRSIEERIAADGLDPVTAYVALYAARGMVSDFIWGLGKPREFVALAERILEMVGGQPAAR